jgi:glycosyltransferase involved in cell wall biosynthesis
MLINRNKILITMPNLNGEGGVATYYNSVLPFLKDSDFQINILEIGSWGRKFNILRPFQDQKNFHYACDLSISLVHINPSLGPKSFWRDGIFAWQTKRKNLPLLVFFRGWDHNFAKIVERKYLRFFNNTFAKADGFIVLASEFKLKLQEWGIKAPIFFETTAVDERLMRNFQHTGNLKSALKRKQVSILFLSRLDKKKGVFETIRAIKILRESGLNIQLTIAGDGVLKREAEKLVAHMHLSGDIIFLGYVRGQKKIDVLETHDIYCLPSNGEGLPNSVLEAMAFGMPVITTPVGGLKDVFQDGNMGFFLKSITPEHIAQQLEKLIVNSDLRSKISSYNFQYAQQHFLASNVAKRLENIYREIIVKTNR